MLFLPTIFLGLKSIVSEAAKEVPKKPNPWHTANGNPFKLLQSKVKVVLENVDCASNDL